jgi:hypothetical protein
MGKSLTLVISLLLCLPVWAKGSHQSHHSSTTTHTKSSSHSHSHSSTSKQYYTNVDGKRVHRPVHATHTPASATAKCGDGTYSFSQHTRGTCSHHGGVANWVRQ